MTGLRQSCTSMIIVYATMCFMYPSGSWLIILAHIHPFFFQYYLSVKWIYWSSLCNLNQGSLFAFNCFLFKLHDKINLSLEISIAAFSFLYTSLKMLKNCILTYMRSYVCCKKKKVCNKFSPGLITESILINLQQIFETWKQRQYLTGKKDLFLFIRDSDKHLKTANDECVLYNIHLIMKRIC